MDRLFDMSDAQSTFGRSAGFTAIAPSLDPPVARFGVQNPYTPVQGPVPNNVAGRRLRSQKA